MRRVSFSSLQAPGALWSIQRKVNHTNHNVGSAGPEITTFHQHCKIEKSGDDRTRTYLQVTQKIKLLKRGKRSDAC